MARPLKPVATCRTFRKKPYGSQWSRPPSMKADTHPGANLVSPQNVISKDDLHNPRESVVVRSGTGRKASFCSQ